METLVEHTLRDGSAQQRGLCSPGRINCETRVSPKFDEICYLERVFPRIEKIRHHPRAAELKHL